MRFTEYQDIGVLLLLMHSDLIIREVQEETIPSSPRTNSSFLKF